MGEVPSIQSNSTTNSASNIPVVDAAKAAAKEAVEMIRNTGQGKTETIPEKLGTELSNILGDGNSSSKMTIEEAKMLSDKINKDRASLDGVLAAIKKIEDNNKSRFEMEQNIKNSHDIAIRLQRKLGVR